ncbi:MAG: hypothetical protein DPW16_12650 [Chloroflexi bacterium]|nr:hypothetical protein [Chloroflexota bacterium]
MGNQTGLHAIMAGSGKPYAAMTARSQQLLMKLHQGVSYDHIPAQLGLSDGEFLATLNCLLDYRLIESHGNGYRPTFFISNADEVQWVVLHAQKIGQLLAHQLVQNWNRLETLFNQLALSKISIFADYAFILVGDRLLDIGLLYALMDHHDLMPPAPKRPSPDAPDAHYYFWMIEGTEDQLGKYGQNQMTLRWSNWFLITFGQYHIQGEPNHKRTLLHQRAIVMLEQADSPESLSQLTGIQLIEPNDSVLWTTGINPYIDTIIQIYRQQETSIRDLYSSLHASYYARYGFAEFFCWYDHLAYSAAIDKLIETKHISLPEQCFASAIWHEPNN